MLFWFSSFSLCPASKATDQFVMSWVLPSVLTAAFPTVKKWRAPSEHAEGLLLHVSFSEVAVERDAGTIVVPSSMLMCVVSVQVWIL